MDNKTSDNRNPTAYMHDVICERKYFADRFRSSILRIVGAGYNYNEDLTIILEDSDKKHFSYSLEDEGVRRQFVFDIKKYSVNKPFPSEYMCANKLKGRRLEAFFKNNEIIAISPIYEPVKELVEAAKSANPIKTEPVKLGNILNKIKGIIEKDNPNNFNSII